MHENLNISATKQKSKILKVVNQELGLFFWGKPVKHEKSRASLLLSNASYLA
jgi:alpha-galactosidase